MTDSLKIIGAHGNRRKNDFYPTPRECTQALVDFLKENRLLYQKDVVWECACGDNAITEVLKWNGFRTWATDIQKGQDFMIYEMQEDFDWIITNPPFCMAEDFIKKASSYGRPFAFLLKSQYWHSAKRLALFKDVRPAFVLPLTWRPNFTGAGASMLDMIWCVWVGASQTTFYEPLEKPKGETDGKRTDR